MHDMYHTSQETFSGPIATDIKKNRGMKKVRNVWWMESWIINWEGHKIIVEYSIILQNNLGDVIMLM